MVQNIKNTADDTQQSRDTETDDYLPEGDKMSKRHLSTKSHDTRRHMMTRVAVVLQLKIARSKRTTTYDNPYNAFVAAQP